MILIAQLHKPICLNSAECDVYYYLIAMLIIITLIHLQWALENHLQVLSRYVMGIWVCGYHQQGAVSRFTWFTCQAMPGCQDEVSLHSSGEGALRVCDNSMLSIFQTVLCSCQMGCLFLGLFFFLFFSKVVQRFLQPRHGSSGPEHCEIRATILSWITFF